jgi:hypothetical protein
LESEVCEKGYRSEGGMKRDPLSKLYVIKMGHSEEWPLIFVED